LFGNDYFSGGCLLKSCDHAENGRFAAPGRAEQYGQTALSHIERNAVYRSDPSPFFDKIMSFNTAHRLWSRLIKLLITNLEIKVNGFVSAKCKRRPVPISAVFGFPHLEIAQTRWRWVEWYETRKKPGTGSIKPSKCKG
jgi:hypothetical protein